MAPVHRNIVIPKGTVTEDKITVIKIPVTAPDNNTPLVVINKNEIYSPNFKPSDAQRLNGTDSTPSNGKRQTKPDSCLDCAPCNLYPDNTADIATTANIANTSNNTTTTTICEPCGTSTENPVVYGGAILNEEWLPDERQNQRSVCSDKVAGEPSCPCDQGAIRNGPTAQFALSVPAPAPSPVANGIFRNGTDPNQSYRNSPPAQSSFPPRALSDKPVPELCPSIQPNGTDASQSYRNGPPDQPEKPERRPCPSTSSPPVQLAVPEEPVKRPCPLASSPPGQPTLSLVAPPEKPERRPCPSASSPPGQPTLSPVAPPEKPERRPCPSASSPPVELTLSPPASADEPVKKPCPLGNGQPAPPEKPARRPCPADSPPVQIVEPTDKSCPCDPTIEEPCPCDPGALCRGPDCRAPRPPPPPEPEPVNECPSTAPKDYPICPSTVEDDKTNEYAASILSKMAAAELEPPIKKIKKGKDAGLIINRTSFNMRLIKPYRAPDGVDPLPCKGKPPKKEKGPPITYLPCPSLDFTEKKEEEVEEEKEPCPDPKYKIIRVAYKQYSQADGDPVEGTSFMYEDPCSQGLSEIAFGQLARSVLEEPPKEEEEYYPPSMCTDQRNLIDDTYLNPVTVVVPTVEETIEDDDDCTC